MSLLLLLLLLLLQLLVWLPQLLLLVSHLGLELHEVAPQRLRLRCRPVGRLAILLRNSLSGGLRSLLPSGPLLRQAGKLCLQGRGALLLVLFGSRGDGSIHQHTEEAAGLARDSRPTIP